MLETPSFELVHSLGKYLVDSGYSVARLGDELELSDALMADLENLEPLLAKTEGDTPIHLLARLFFVGWPIEEERCRSLLDSDFLNNSLACGLLRQVEGKLEAIAYIVPFRGRLYAADSARLRVGNPEAVMGPSASTQLIARTAVGGHGETTLDLGTGSGILAIEATLYSKRVVGVDVNERTLQYGVFNASLNGIGPEADLRFLAGDTFAPVAGQQFTRIIANPPFFLAPAKTFTYSDSPMELDSFCRRLAKEAPQYLSEGGYFQMLCEFVTLEDSPWEQRLREWTAGSGCDVLILLGCSQSPLSYSEKRASEARQMHKHKVDSLFTERLNFFNERRVKRIMGAIVTMRKRSGDNWFHVVGIERATNVSGANVIERFASLTLLETHSSAQLMDLRFRMTEDAWMQHSAALKPNGWEIINTELTKSGALLDRIRLDETVAGFIPLFDGSHTVSEIASEVSSRLNVSPEDGAERCLLLVRRLLQGSLVYPVTLSGVNGTTK